MELFAHGGESSIGSIVGKIVSPTTLQLNMIVDLVDHLLKLTRIDTIGAHNDSFYRGKALLSLFIRLRRSLFDGHQSMHCVFLL